MARPSSSTVSGGTTILSPATRVVALVSSYHEDITGAMADSALATLIEAGLEPENWMRVAAPGAFELPLLAQRAVRNPDVDAVLCFGLVIKGETPHDVYISQATAEGLMQVGLDSGKPVLFGVLTTNTLEQAQTRARLEGDGGLDKGREVARACINVLASLAQIDGQIDR